MLQSTVATTKSGMDKDDTCHLTVDEVARRAGTTTRNVRALQTLGLLSRPRLSGRTGLYGQDHLDRLQAILRLQQTGFSLGAIGALFDAWERGLTLEDVLGVSRSSTSSRHPGVDPDDEWGAFADWPTPRPVGALAIVPTTVLDQMAS
jgi:DNA-binding transcriptional MerR regulator